LRGEAVLTTPEDESSENDDPAEADALSKQTLEMTVPATEAVKPT
jgi:hypothetical protein